MDRAIFTRMQSSDTGHLIGDVQDTYTSYFNILSGEDELTTFCELTRMSEFCHKRYTVTKNHLKIILS